MGLIWPMGRSLLISILEDLASVPSCLFLTSFLMTLSLAYCTPTTKAVLLSLKHTMQFPAALPPRLLSS